jgi:membrane associated rhomboid family serine protease
MFRSLPSITKNLLIINLLMFILGLFLENKGVRLEIILSTYFPYSPNFKYFQVLSHMFMHANFSHLLFNMLALWSFGKPMELTLGPKKFMILYVAAGLSGFLVYNAWNYIEIKPVFEHLSAQNFDFTEFYQYVLLNSNGTFVQDPKNFSYPAALHQDAQAVFIYQAYARG